jgi:membrane protease YdiL (CAAX protease family)
MTDIVRGDVEVNAPPPPLPPSIAAGGEAIGCLIALLVSAGLFKTTLISLLRSLSGSSSFFPNTSQYEDLVGSAAQILGVFCGFVLLYSARLRPSDSWFIAMTRVSRAACVAVCMPTFPSLFASLLLAFNTVFIAAVYWYGGNTLHARFLQCALPTPIFWAPLLEEFLFRGSIFWVALHRSRGDVQSAALVAAGAFAAVHAPLVIAARAHIAYVALQVVAAGCLGGAWTMVFARRGRLGEVILLHFANNIAGLVWAALVGIEEAPNATGVAACDRAVPQGTFLRVTGAIALLIQIVLASWITAVIWRQLKDGGIDAIVKAHPIVFNEDEVEVVDEVSKNE